jgi:hypothetical protein
MGADLGVVAAGYGAAAAGAEKAECASAKPFSGEAEPMKGQAQRGGVSMDEPVNEKSSRSDLCEDRGCLTSVPRKTEFTAQGDVIVNPFLDVNAKIIKILDGYKSGFNYFRPV